MNDLFDNKIKWEYHAFGPWILEVNDTNPLPPLFLPHYKDDNNHLMLVKVPRDIDRTDAKEGMDLYDYVIGLYEEYIYILKRVDKRIEETRVFYYDIDGVEDYRNLLNGMLTFYIKDKQITIPYNSVSEEIVIRIIKIVRDRYSKKTFNIIPQTAPDKDLRVETLYINLLSSMMDIDTNLQVGAVQPSVNLAMRRGKLIQRLLRLLTGEKLLNTLHLINDKELIVMSKRKSFKKFNEVVHGYVNLYLPMEKLNSINLESPSEDSALQELRISLISREFKFYFEENNKELINFYNQLDLSMKA